MRLRPPSLPHQLYPLVLGVGLVAAACGQGTTADDVNAGGGADGPTPTAQGGGPALPGNGDDTGTTLVGAIDSQAIIDRYGFEVCTGAAPPGKVAPERGTEILHAATGAEIANGGSTGGDGRLVETANPTASVKDRTSRWMIDAAEASGALPPGGTIVESSSGNTGIALAALGTERGYRVVIVCGERVSSEKVNLLRLLGAEVRQVGDADLGTDEHYLKLAAQMADELGGVFLNQYENQANPQAHYDTTGPEIWEQMDHNTDVFVAGAGTWGTSTGAGRYLKEQDPNIEIVMADPVGSIDAHAHANGGELSDPAPYRVEAVGQAERMIPSSIDLTIVDRLLSIADDDSFAAARSAAPVRPGLWSQQRPGPGRRSGRGGHRQTGRPHRHLVA